MIVKKEDIIGAWVSEDGVNSILVCEKCLTKEDWDELEQEKIVNEADKDKTDDLYFCDRCKKQF